MPSNTESLLSSDKLRCPKCAGTLLTPAKPVCGGCGLEFPVLDDIPVLAPNPAELVGLWHNRFANFASGQQRNIQSNNQLSASVDVYPPLRERLKRVSQARMENLRVIAELMSPLHGLAPGIPPTSHTDSPGFFTALVYLFRDWGWETNEVDILCNKVIEILPVDLSLESLLVLGAGGCRASFNLHNHYRCPFTVSVDISPLMLLAAKRIVSGGELDLYQILPNNVRDERDNLSFWKLRAPRKPDHDFLFLLADATHMPFAENSFHAILTPFIIDEIGIDLREFARLIHRTLKPGGYWINYGAMTFLPRVNYTAKEALAIVGESGFRVLRQGFSTQSHAAPRESCQRQVFDCLYFSAVKE